MWIKPESMASVDQLKKSSATKKSFKYSHPSILETKRGMVRSICLACKACISIVFLSFYLPFCFARDNITLNDSISDGETIISAGEIFELGFFTPSNRSNDNRRYVGIWYYRSDPKTIVWVANRNAPLKNTNGVFGIAKNGILELFDEHKKAIWKPDNLEGRASFQGTVKLWDSGNLVLTKEDEEGGSLRVIWESFKDPTDTFLPGMKMDENLILYSWASPDNPAKGKFKFQLVQNHYIIKEGMSICHWKSGVSGKFMSDDIPPIVSSLLSNSDGSDVDPRIIRHNTSNNKVTPPSNFNRSNLRLVMSSEGKLQSFTQFNKSTPWKPSWWEPMDLCDGCKYCGNFASCNRSNRSNSMKCKCLPGFVSISREDWNSGGFSQGCQRTKPLCSSNVKKKIRDFFPLKVLKVGEPDDSFEADSEIKCKEECLRNCDCQAYSYETSQLRGFTGNTTCWIWSQDLNNIQLDDTDGEREIQLRVQHDITAEPNESKQDGGTDETNEQIKQWPLVIAVIVVTSVTALACTFVYIYRRKMSVKKQEEMRSNLPLHLYDGQRHVKELIDSGGFNEVDKKGIDLPFFDFESILAATDNFSEANKLGKGGFGPVYKGNFPGGQEIAVKRLSRVSGQGMEEFKNEVVLIARLQHRNLVRLLGYCIEGDEKILLYEFMPNKSLDSFIFDTNLSELLDWEMRLNIILGIARGLVYLHQDSRLRIIHRDLKTSNILLDGEMNPKISDFGLARIFEGKQTEGSTNRVVGTYGYMSPEYALDGFFSIKSDVFSFGVVVLEIICGKRNTGFYNSQEALSLLGYAWRLWQEGKALDMMDQKLSAGPKTRTHEILKCINIGLLCVQEDPDDRPTMSDVVILISSVTATLPTPKRPAFVVRRSVFNSMASSSSSKAETNNEITVTLEAR